MSILRSFNVGVTGLSATGESISIIGDNIANASTYGFKSSRPSFQDMLAKNLKGIDGGDQMGSGTKIAHVTPLFTQGTVVHTESPTDLAVNGNGFFALDAPFGRAFTRDGSFHFDKKGFLVTSDGYEVLGFQADRNGKLSNRLEKIKLGNTVIPATSTKEASFLLNLDSRENVKEFNIEKPYETSSYSSSVNVYDNIGTARMVSLFFNKTAENIWQYHALVEGGDVEGGDPNKMVEMGSGTLTFNDKGVLKTETEGTNSFNFNKGAAPDQKITFNFGTSLDEGGTGLDVSTQYGSQSNTSRHSKDGASAATLTSLSFNDKGLLTAIYDNGEIRDLARITLALFENNEGLIKMGKNLFKEGRQSGEPAIGSPGDNGRGEVLSKSLELSNVDIAQEFVGLITQQRNFQANSRTVTTADKMIDEVLRMKG